MKYVTTELIIPLVLLAVLISLVLPLGLASGHAMVMAKQGVLLAGFVAFALWVWREAGGDERDNLHRMLTSRLAYVIGSGITVAGILYQSLHGLVDAWLVWALVGMVLTKVIGSVWARLRH